MCEHAFDALRMCSDLNISDLVKYMCITLPWHKLTLTESTSTFEDSCGCTVLHMPETREMTEQIEWGGGGSSGYRVSKDLKC